MANEEGNLLVAKDLNGKIIIHLDLDAFEVQIWLRKYDEDGEKFSSVLKNSNAIATHFRELNHSERLLQPIVLCNYARVIVSKNQVALRKYPEELKKGDILKKGFLLQHPKLVVLEIPSDKWSFQDTLTRMKEDDRVLKCIIQEWNKLREAGLNMVIERKYLDEVTIDVTAAVSSALDLPQGFTTSREKLASLNKEYYAPEKLIKCLPEGTSLTTLKDERLIKGVSIANHFMKCILREIGYTVSCGVAYGDDEAKKACQVNKPSGICVDSKPVGRYFHLHHASLTVERKLKNGTPRSKKEDGKIDLEQFINDLAEDFAEKWNYQVSTGAICGINVDFRIKVTIYKGIKGTSGNEFKTEELRGETGGGGSGKISGKEIAQQIWTLFGGELVDSKIIAIKVFAAKKLGRKKKRALDEGIKEESSVKIPKMEDTTSD